MKTKFDLFSELENATKIILDVAVKNVYNLNSSLPIEYPVESDKDVIKVGFFAIPVFSLSKELKKNPNEIAKELSDEFNKVLASFELKINDKSISLFLHAQNVAQYINIYIKEQECANIVLKDIVNDTFSYLKVKPSKQTIVLDFSSPNIAKPFGIGHLRSTIIGNALFKILRHNGYNVTRVNHLGDWGTQFGKLIAAYELFGNNEDLLKNPIDYLLELYVKYNKLEETDKSYTEKAREYFKRLENNDPQTVKIWELFRELSLEHFKNIYDTLQIDFDHYSGESYYIEHTDYALSELKKKNLLIEDDGALIVDLDEYKLGKVIVVKSNETSTYFLRDLTAAICRIKKMHAKKLFYVVGSEQKLYFAQLFKVLQLLGYDKIDFEHIDFGFLKSTEGKFSTRKGNILKFEDVFEKTMELVDEKMSKKIDDKSLKNIVVKHVAMSSIFYADLSNDRIKDIIFDWNKLLDFEGDTGPYILYTIVRANSILDKSGYTENEILAHLNKTLLVSTDVEKRLIAQLMRFKKVLDICESSNKPHHLARFAMDLAKRYNELYHSCQVIGEEHDLMYSRLVMTLATKYLLELSIRMLGIKPVKNM